jgi:hypothetical protein
MGTLTVIFGHLSNKSLPTDRYEILHIILIKSMSTPNEPKIVEISHLGAATKRQHVYFTFFSYIVLYIRQMDRFAGTMAEKCVSRE